MKKRIVDQLGRQIEFNFPPQRIISLVPSQTELLFDLGVGDRVVGISKFCVHPEEWFKSKPKVGGTKKFDFEIIDQLQPDLIIGNKEENYEKGITQLGNKYPVWMSDIASWESAISMIHSVGDLVNETKKATLVANKIEDEFMQIKKVPPARALYFIWRAPWMVAGQNTFINTMLSKIGLANGMEQDRYPELSFDEMKRLSPQIILLSSEPFPFQARHVEELRQILPHAKIVVVDGEMFSWYGSRLAKAPGYFSTLVL